MIGDGYEDVPTMTIAVVVVEFASHVRIWGEYSTNHSPTWRFLLVSLFGF